MPTPQEQLIDQKYKNWWIQAGYWMLNQGGGIGTGSVVAPTSVTITGNTSVDVNTDVTLTANVNPGNVSLPLTYTWNVDGGTITSGTGTAVIDVQWSTSGSKTVSVTVSNSAGSVNDSHTVTVSSPSPLLTDLAAYWKLDDLTWSDNVGSNHLTNNGGVVLGTPKLGAGSAEFDGTNYLSRGDDPALRIDPVNGFTISVWFYPTLITGRHTIISKWNPGYLLRLNSSDLEFYLNDGSNQLISISGITTGSWHHAIAWYDPTAQRSYLQLNNGTPSQSAATFTPLAGSASFVIGATDTGTNIFNGRIDEPGKWDEVLTNSERDDLWNSGSGLSYPF